MEQEKKYSNYLKEKGYRVTGPMVGTSDVNDAKGVVGFFYQALDEFKGPLKMGYPTDSARNIAVAQRFINSRMRTGIDKKRACHECCELILVLFTNEKQFNFPFQISSISIFGQEKFAWLDSVLLDIYNVFGKNTGQDKRFLLEEETARKQQLAIEQEALKDLE